MKKVVVLTVLIALRIIPSFAQCTNQVLNTSGVSHVNGVTVSVASTGVVDVNSVYCTSTFPYFIGYKYNPVTNGNGRYVFNFSPAVSAATLNFSGISGGMTAEEEVLLFVNGSHYAIPSPGISNGCDFLALLTAQGNIEPCSGCGASGWSGTTINGSINSIVVMDSVLFGTPNGAIFSLFICDSVTTGLQLSETKTGYQLFPNPFISKTVLHADTYFSDATLSIYNSLGRQVFLEEDINGSSLVIDRSNLPPGIYFLRLTENNNTLLTEKVVIRDY